MNKGLFITFEGPDGCGKSTQIRLFEEYLKQSGYDVICTREPGGTKISEEIRGIILDPKNTEEHPVTEMLLYAAARAQIVTELIKPSVESGKMVICDRFIDSSIAYQGYARGLGEQVEIVNKYAVMGYMPDITFLLDISAEDARKRNAATDKRDRLELEKIDFHKKVCEGYHVLAEKYKDRIVVIDASKDAETVFAQIKSEFIKKINLK